METLGSILDEVERKRDDVSDRIRMRDGSVALCRQ